MIDDPRGERAALTSLTTLKLGPAALAASLAALLLAPQAGATILPQRGIMGIDLEMTRSDVVRVAGKPDAEKVLPHPIMGKQRVMRYGMTRVHLGPVSNDVFSIVTRDPDEVTPSGVGVGSTVAEVRAGILGVLCRREFGFRHCWKGRFRAGKPVTDFSIEAGRVSSVTVGTVID